MDIFFLAGFLAGGRVDEVVALAVDFFGADLVAGRAFGRVEDVMPVFFAGGVAFLAPARF
jgi:hypothetical protein